MELIRDDATLYSQDTMLVTGLIFLGYVVLELVTLPVQLIFASGLGFEVFCSSPLSNRVLLLFEASRESFRDGVFFISFAPFSLTWYASSCKQQIPKRKFIRDLGWFCFIVKGGRPQMVYAFCIVVQRLGENVNAFDIFDAISHRIHGNAIFSHRLVFLFKTCFSQSDYKLDVLLITWHFV